jgi:peptidoglycan/xylan/chitin deacetylase (PgdA/CDA1 family)/GT2 family glycosyltransferase
VAVVPAEDASLIQTSIVLATFNRAERLQRCLEALAHQTEPASSFEVIVVVDGSIDSTGDVLARFHAPFALRVIWQDNRGQSVALNRGAAAARGRTCLFLDDDIVAAPELVAEHARVHRMRDGIVGIGQLTLSLPPHAGWFARSFAGEWRTHYAALNEGKRLAGWQACFGGNLSVARAAFVDVGGFDPSLARAYDLELGYRLAERGCAFVYLADALGTQDHRKDFRSLVVDSERAGVASVELSRRYPVLLPILLGAFAEQPLTMSTALRLLLATGASAEHLEPLGWLVRLGLGADNAYRLLQRYSFWRGVHHAWPDGEHRRDLTSGTPILMYHALGAPGERASRFVVPVRRFARQMAWLAVTGCRVLSLDELLRCRAEHRLPPARSVVITIDDGYADTRSLAYPILRSHDFPATLALVSDRIGTANDWDPHSEITGRQLMSWSEIRELRQRGGLEFAAHTRTHPDLTGLPPESARMEIEGSRALLQDQLGVPIRSFAYPYGKRNPNLVAMVERAGFDAGLSIDSGLNTAVTPAGALRRVEVHGTDSMLQFALAVRFGIRTDQLHSQVKRAMRSRGHGGD